MAEEQPNKWFKTDLADWELNEKGEIKFSPVIGWATSLLKSGMAGGILIKFGTDVSMKELSAHQFLMTAKQIRELGQMLTKMADDLDARLTIDKPPGPLS